MTRAQIPLTSKKLLASRLYLLLIAAFIPLSGCHIGQHVIGLVVPKDTGNILESNKIPPLSALSLGVQPEASRHADGVILVRSLPGSSATVLSVGQDGSVIGWDLAHGKGHKVNQLPGKVRVATLGERKGLIAWSDDKGVFVGCLFGCSQQKEL